jgi:hypothetical protein
MCNPEIPRVVFANYLHMYYTLIISIQVYLPADDDEGSP